MRKIAVVTGLLLTLSTGIALAKEAPKAEGRVTLKGLVVSEHEKAKLEELAKGCPGVTSVKNMLTIAPKSK